MKQQFENDGFYINTRQRLSEEVVRKGIDGMMSVRRGEYDTGRGPEASPWNPGDSDDILCKIEMPQLASRAIFDLVSHPLLGDLAAEATGAEWVQVWWVQLLYKPPTRAGATTTTNIGWHQDRNYWQMWEKDSQLLTAWVALSDVTLETGPMSFVRGSHRWGLSSGSDFDGQDLAGIKAAINIPAGETWEEVPAILPPGAFSLHHDLTWHGSGPNHSQSTRLAFAIHLRTEKSNPLNNKREGLTKYIDDHTVCPVVYERGPSSSHLSISPSP